MKTIDRRLIRLELRLLPSPEDLSDERAIGEMLIAGEWQMALQVLEHQDTSLVKEWQSKSRRAYGREVTKFDFRDLTRMRIALDASLRDVPDETRYRLAALLMASDAPNPIETQESGRRA